MAFKGRNTGVANEIRETRGRSDETYWPVRKNRAIWSQYKKWTIKI